MNSIKLEMLHLWSGHVGLNYERTLSRSFTAQIDFDLGDLATGSIDGQRDYTLSAAVITPELRYYPFKNKSAPLGFFIGEWFRYAAYREDYRDISRRGAFPIMTHTVVKSFGLNAGYKFSYKNFCIEPSAGINLVDQVSTDPAQGFIPVIYSDNLSKDEQRFYRFKLMLGYLFPRQRESKN